MQSVLPDYLFTTPMTVDSMSDVSPLMMSPVVSCSNDVLGDFSSLNDGKKAEGASEVKVDDQSGGDLVSGTTRRKLRFCIRQSRSQFRAE